jgi:hypothetical protein
LATDGILDYFFKSFADRALGFFLPVWNLVLIMGPLNKKKRKENVFILARLIELT